MALLGPAQVVACPSVERGLPVRPLPVAVAPGACDGVVFPPVPAVASHREIASVERGRAGRASLATRLSRGGQGTADGSIKKRSAARTFLVTHLSRGSRNGRVVQVPYSIN